MPELDFHKRKYALDTLRIKQEILKIQGEIKAIKTDKKSIHNIEEIHKLEYRLNVLELYKWGVI